MKKKLIVLVTFLFVLVSILGVLAACDEPEATKYTVTFKNGDTTVKTVEVEEGNALAASDIPADPTAPAGKEFDGWYVGSTKVEAGYKPTADVTALAKFVDETPVVPETVTVTFVVDGKTVKTVTINKGETIPTNQLPSEPTAEDAGLDADIYTFAGWFDANNNEFVETAAVNASVTYTAKFDKGAVYTLKFIDGSNVTTVEIAAKADAKLAEDAIPAQAAVSGKVAQGWYTSDGLKAEADMAITSDMDFYAMSVGQSDYTGAWLDTVNHKMIVFAGTNVYIDGQSYGVFYENGLVTVGEGSGYSRQEWTLSILGDTLTVQHSGYDEYEDWVDDAPYTLTKGAEVDYAGTYRNGQYMITVENGGAISTLFAGNQGGGIYRYAVLVKDGENYKIEYYASSSATQLTEIAVSLENGLIIVDGASSTYNGWYVEASGCVTYSKYESGVGYYRLYVYTTESGVVYVYSTPEEINYATVEGEIEDGEIITIKVAEQADVIVKISGSDLVFAGEEAGSYTGEAGVLVLDGFGNATLGEAEFEYNYANGRVVASDSSVGYAIDLEGHTYTVLQKDGHEGTYTYVREASAVYVVVLDGYGTFRHTYNGGSLYVGSYTIESDTTMTVADANYSYNGTWTIAYQGNVLIIANGLSTNGYTYVKEGYTIPVEPNEQFDGTWQDESENTVVIDLAEMTINYKGQTADLTCSTDGNELTFTVKDLDSAYTSNDSKYTVTIVEGKLTIVHNCNKGWDSSDEDYIWQKVTETFTKVGGESNPFDGIWKDESGNTVVIDYAAKTIQYKGQTYTFTVKADGVTLTFKAKDSNDAYGNEYDHNVTIVDGKLQIVHTYMTGWDDMDEDYTYATSTELFTKQDSEEEGDALKGKWVFESWTFEFDGNGKVTINGSTTVDYEFDGTNVSFNYDWEDWTGTLSEDGNTLTLSDEYGDGFGYNHPCKRA